MIRPRLVVRVDLVRLLYLPNFKERYRNHTASFRHKSKMNETELSKHIWTLNDNNKPFTIKWRVLKQCKRFWSRHVLLSGPKLQNTNCTNKFSTAVTRHKQQTSGQLQTANNTTVKGFFRFMSLVSVSFHQSCPSFDGMHSIDNTSRQVLLSKECLL